MKIRDLITEKKKSTVPYGSDVSSGTYRCVDCDYEYSNQSKTSLPPCPHYEETSHPQKSWKILSGQGDAVDDPYPNR